MPWRVQIRGTSISATSSKQYAYPAFLDVCAQLEAERDRRNARRKKPIPYSPLEFHQCLFVQEAESESRRVA